MNELNLLGVKNIKFVTGYTIDLEGKPSEFQYPDIVDDGTLITAERHPLNKNQFIYFVTDDSLSGVGVVIGCDYGNIISRSSLMGFISNSVSQPELIVWVNTVMQIKKPMFDFHLNQTLLNGNETKGVIRKVIPDSELPRNNKGNIAEVLY